MHHISPAPLFVAAALCGAVTAQTTWSLQTPATSPPAFTAHATAYHQATDATIMFGGLFGGTRYDSTWSWNGTDWTLLTPTTVPEGRVAHGMDLDLGRQRLVMFGGLGAASGTLGDTWEWDGVDWIQMQPTTSPAPRWAYALAYHPLRATTMLFGGYAGGDLDETWEWDGTNWTQVITTNSPSMRRATAMAWDPVTGNMILFSGYQQAADTWMFDGVDWVQLTPATTPPARYDHAMVTDHSRNRIVMFGDLANGDTWEWDGSDWIDRTNGTAPPPRIDTYLSYDWAREQILMYGSVAQSETWIYEPTTPATWSANPSSGCPGTSGLPPVLGSTDRPWIGETFTVQIGQLPANSFGLMIVGLSNTMSGGTPLPASLASIGMPGCQLEVDPVVVDALLATGTSATWQFPIANQAALLGQAFYCQCGALDIGANAANLTTGNHGMAVVGGK